MLLANDARETEGFGSVSRSDQVQCAEDRSRLALVPREFGDHCDIHGAATSLDEIASIRIDIKPALAIGVIAQAELERSARSSVTDMYGCGDVALRSLAY